MAVSVSATSAFATTMSIARSKRDREIATHVLDKMAETPYLKFQLEPSVSAIVTVSHVVVVMAVAPRR